MTLCKFYLRSPIFDGLPDIVPEHKMKNEKENKGRPSHPKWNIVNNVNILFVFKNNNCIQLQKIPAQ